LLIGYLFVSRRRLRFPNALLLVPLGTALVWLLNGFRIALLVVVGARLSPAVALGGFHSKAGWISVCLVVVAIVALSQKLRFFSREVESSQRVDNPAAAYCLPLLVTIGCAMLTGLFAAGIDWFYAMRVLGACLVLWLYRREYRSLVALDRAFLPYLNGALVFVFWFALTRGAGPEAGSTLLADLTGADPRLRAAWLGFRVVGSVILIPIVEELAFRGFLQRRLIAADFSEVPQQRFSWLSLVGSAIAFGGLHQAWIAGTMAGLAYSLATYRRGRLTDAVLAHATTNALIAIAVLGFGQWWLW